MFHLKDIDVLFERYRAFFSPEKRIKRDYTKKLTAPPQQWAQTSSSTRPIP